MTFISAGMGQCLFLGPVKRLLRSLRCHVPSFVPGVGAKDRGLYKRQLVGIPSYGKELSCILKQLYNMLSFIRAFAERLHFSQDLLSKIELACEEALVNVISYAFSGQKGVIEIRCIELSNRGIKIVIQDNGMHFNPLTEVKEVDPATSLENRNLGGYGVFLLRHVMDEVDYQRIKDLNVLTLVKYQNS